MGAEGLLGWDSGTDGDAGFCGWLSFLGFEEPGSGQTEAMVLARDRGLQSY